MVTALEWLAAIRQTPMTFATVCPTANSFLIPGENQTQTDCDKKRHALHYYRIEKIAKDGESHDDGGSYEKDRHEKKDGCP
jgi:hypothetical protein